MVSVSGYTPVRKSSAHSLEGNRRGLGPGGTRGTIELLCRGGGQIAAQEVPTVVGHKKHQMNAQIEGLALCF